LKQFLQAVDIDSTFSERELSGIDIHVHFTPYDKKMFKFMRAQKSPYRIKAWVYPHIIDT